MFQSDRPAEELAGRPREATAVISAGDAEGGGGVVGRMHRGWDWVRIGCGGLGPSQKTRQFLPHFPTYSASLAFCRRPPAAPMNDPTATLLGRNVHPEICVAAAARTSSIAALREPGGRRSRGKRRSLACSERGCIADHRCWRTATFWRATQFHKRGQNRRERDRSSIREGGNGSPGGTGVARFGGQERPRITRISRIPKTCPNPFRRPSVADDCRGERPFRPRPSGN